MRESSGLVFVLIARLVATMPEVMNSFFTQKESTLL